MSYVQVGSCLIKLLSNNVLVKKKQHLQWNKFYQLCIIAINKELSIGKSFLLVLNNERDLKPENILYEQPGDNATLKIIDFGTSRVFKSNNEKMNQKFGTVSLLSTLNGFQLALLYCSWSAEIKLYL